MALPFLCLQICFVPSQPRRCMTQHVRVRTHPLPRRVPVSKPRDPLSALRGGVLSMLSGRELRAGGVEGACTTGGPASLAISAAVENSTTSSTWCWGATVATPATGRSGTKPCVTEISPKLGSDLRRAHEAVVAITRTCQAHCVRHKNGRAVVQRAVRRVRTGRDESAAPTQNGSMTNWRP